MLGLYTCTVSMERDWEGCLRVPSLKYSPPYELTATCSCQRVISALGNLRSCERAVAAPLACLPKATLAQQAQICLLWKLCTCLSALTLCQVFFFLYPQRTQSHVLI